MRTPATVPATVPAIVIALGVGADVAAVLVFAAAGRRTHEEPATLLGLLSTAGPFLIGLAIAWLLTRAWRTPSALRTGLWVWMLTAGLGLSLRAAGTGRLPWSFALVAVLVLGLLLLGWRALVAVRKPRMDRQGGGGA